MTIRSFFNTSWTLTKRTFFEWYEDDALKLGASLAYYTVFSLAPLLLILVSILSAVYGAEAARGELAGQLQNIMGPEAAKSAQALIQSANRPSAGFSAGIIGFALVLFGASGAFADLQSALNRIWRVKGEVEGGVGAWAKRRLMAFLTILGIGLVILSSLVLSSALTAIGKEIADLSPLLASLVPWLDFLLSFLVISVLIGLIFKVLPDVELGWRDVALGACVTAFMFSLGKIAIGFYLGKSSVASVYGAAGSLVVILLWVYYSSQILFLGAEFTQVYHRWWKGEPLSA